MIIRRRIRTIMLIIRMMMMMMRIRMRSWRRRTRRTRSWRRRTTTKVLRGIYETSRICNLSTFPTGDSDSCGLGLSAMQFGQTRAVSVCVQQGPNQADRNEPITSTSTTVTTSTTTTCRDRVTTVKVTTQILSTRSATSMLYYHSTSHYTITSITKTLSYSSQSQHQDSNGHSV